MQKPVPTKTQRVLLPVAAFNAFKAAVKAPGRVVSGLARAAEASKDLLKDADWEK